MTLQTGTIGAALTGAAALLRGETLSPALDAELLLAHMLKRPREAILAHRDEALPAAAARIFTSLIRRRAEGVPLPYLTGHKEFYGRTFAVTPAVMVPRPESEAIVEEALRLLDAVPRHPTPRTRHPIIADIGTGSGVLAVSIAAEAARVHIVVTDKSAAALLVARRNARKHKMARRMTFIESDLLTEIPLELAPHIIVANLPYIPSDELQRAGDAPDTRGLTFEPQRALDGGPDGLFVVRRFFAQLKRLGSEQSHFGPRASRDESAVGSRLQHIVLEHSPGQRRQTLETAYRALPVFTPRAVTPFVSCWTRAPRP